MECNKVSYESKAEAQKDAKIVTANMGWFNRAYQKKKGKLIPYRCRYCGDWHLTSKKVMKKPFKPATA